MPMIETISTEAAATYLRERGMRISKETIQAGLRQNKFPFGLCVEGKGGSPVYMIFVKQLREWARERMVEDE